MLARNAIVEGLPATKVPVLGMPEPWSSRVPPEVMEVVPLLVKCAEMKVSPLPPDLVSAPSLVEARWVTAAVEEVEIGLDVGGACGADVEICFVADADGPSTGPGRSAVDG